MDARRGQPFWNWKGSDTDSDGDTIMHDQRPTLASHGQAILPSSPQNSGNPREQHSDNHALMSGQSHLWPLSNRSLPAPRIDSSIPTDARRAVSSPQFQTSPLVRSQLLNANPQYYQPDPPFDPFRSIPRATSYNVNHDYQGSQPTATLPSISIPQSHVRQFNNAEHTSATHNSRSERPVRREASSMRLLPPLQIGPSQRQPVRQAAPDLTNDIPIYTRRTSNASNTSIPQLDHSTIAARLLTQLAQTSSSPAIPQGDYHNTPSSASPGSWPQTVSRVDPPSNSDRWQMWSDTSLSESSDVSPRGSTLNDRPIAVPTSRRQVKKAPEVKKPKMISCTGCMEEFLPSLLLPAPCSCRYCKDCLNDLFRSGCSNIESFPPSCHGQPFRINIFGELLEKDVLERYKAVELEFSTKKPLYCAQSACSKFIEEVDIVPTGNYGICQVCSNCTCTLCKMLLSAHEETSLERLCPEEPEALKALRDLSKREMWASCPSCNTMIEKIDGCDHMSCQCGIEFCYVCAAFFNEFDECECASDEISDRDSNGEESSNGEEDEETEVWPRHRRMMDAFGRPRCAHIETDVMNGDICHGCLARRGNPPNTVFRVHRCLRCFIELCGSCLSGETEDRALLAIHERLLERERQERLRA